MKKEEVMINKTPEQIKEKMEAKFKVGDKVEKIRQSYQTLNEDEIGGDGEVVATGPHAVIVEWPGGRQCAYKHRHLTYYSPFSAKQDPMEFIASKDPGMAQAVNELIEYLASTYGEKYANSDLPTNGLLNSSSNGKGFNMGNAAKYISRYLTVGFSKSELIEDLKKTIHYTLFELKRRNGSKI